MVMCSVHDTLKISCQNFRETEPGVEGGMLDLDGIKNDSQRSHCGGVREKIILGGWVQSWLEGRGGDHALKCA